MKYTSCITPWFSVNTSKTYYLAVLLETLQKPTDLETDPYWQTKGGELMLKLSRLVVAEFYRREFDSKYDDFKLRGRGEDFRWSKAIVEAEAALWSTIWRMLERLDSLGLMAKLPVDVLIPQDTILPAWMYQLAIEREILMQFFTDSSELGGGGATQLMKKQQNFNRQLAVHNNPAKMTFSRPFLIAADDAASRFDAFQKNYFAPMIRSRMAVTCLLKKWRLINLDGRVATQGRKKQ
jgi:hypothetical protein